MDTIVFYNEKGVMGFENAMIADIQRRFDSISPRFINFVFADNLKNIAFSNFILVISSTIRTSSVKLISSTAHVIVNSGNIRCIKRLAGCRGRVYTCGYSNKDFVTYSSRNENSAMVSLQRNVDIEGVIYEPFEILCEVREGHTDYSVLASMLSLVLLQIIPN